MSAKRFSDKLRTWIEIDRAKARRNFLAFRSLIEKKTQLWCVVKSNAYGHGLLLLPKILDSLGADGFCVDSVVEGFRLRDEGIQKPILVLGYTLPVHLEAAAERDIAVSVSSIDVLKSLVSFDNPPKFHLKVDTGMHRQGVYPEDMKKVLSVIKRHKNTIKSFTGIFSHFSGAKDMTYPGYSELQFSAFEKALSAARKAGFTRLTRHIASTGGTLLDKKYHLDAARIGIGLYGIYPSKEFEMQRPDVALSPVLSWRTIVSEVKPIKKGSYVGYDLTERMTHDGKIAVLPIGYWHGYPRALSGSGEVLIRGRRARVVGRVSMDLIVVDVTGVPVRMGDVATLIGRDGKNLVTPDELSERSDTTSYEFLTRINPLIRRVGI